MKIEERMQGREGQEDKDEGQKRKEDGSMEIILYGKVNFFLEF